MTTANQQPLPYNRERRRGALLKIQVPPGEADVLLQLPVRVLDPDSFMHNLQLKLEQVADDSESFTSDEMDVIQAIKAAAWRSVIENLAWKCIITFNEHELDQLMQAQAADAKEQADG